MDRMEVEDFPSLCLMMKKSTFRLGNFDQIFYIAHRLALIALNGGKCYFGTIIFATVSKCYIAGQNMSKDLAHLCIHRGSGRKQ